MNLIAADTANSTPWRSGTLRQKYLSTSKATEHGGRRTSSVTQRTSVTTRRGQQLSALTDEELIARVQAGQTRVFDVLVIRHQRRVHQLALTLMRNEQDAQEIVQDAFLRAFVGIQRFRGASSFYTWLHRIVVNLAIDIRRHPLKHRMDWECIAERVDDTRGLEFPKLGDSDPFEVTRRAELQRQLNTALSRLNPFHRAVILMREVEGMSYQDMAAELRISKGTVMSRLFHARRRLQGYATECVVP